MSTLPKILKEINRNERVVAYINLRMSATFTHNYFRKPCSFYSDGFVWGFFVGFFFGQPKKMCFVNYIVAFVVKQPIPWSGLFKIEDCC